MIELLLLAVATFSSTGEQLGITQVDLDGDGKQASTDHVEILN